MINNSTLDYNVTLKIKSDYVDIYKNPTIGYMFNIERRTLVKNILQSFTLKDYIVQGTDRPEFVAYKLYGDVEYIWIILIANDVLDPYFDWVCPSQTIYEYTEQKYANLGGPNAIRHYVSADKEMFYNVVQKPNTQEWYDVLDTDFEYLQYKGFLDPVTYIAYELAKNESNRNIKVLNPTELATFQYKLVQAIKEAGI